MLASSRLRGILLVATSLFSLLNIAKAEYVDSTKLDACPGYKATDVKVTGPKLTAKLVLDGHPCNVFGNDTKTLNLAVTYETETRIHLKITDASSERYEVPESVLPRPSADPHVRLEATQLKFNYTASPFSFKISRGTTGEVLFTTASFPLIFEPQYLRLKTLLPVAANIYGLGEHTEPFRLDTSNTTRTLWARDAYGIPRGTNLYGSHPVYFEHRAGGTHAVLLLSSSGMDVKLRNNDTMTGDTTLEYNVIGGVLDFYFLAGSETDPAEAARQYAQIAGLPAEVPYWSFGLHQCRYGYQNYLDVAGVIANYSAASIPLETMWTDIDYMYERRVFTMDPQYFPTARMRDIIDYLHKHNQRYVLMTDPAIAYLPGKGYGTYDRGTELDLWLKAANGSSSLGVVWPGVTVYPDWFHPQSWTLLFSRFWTEEFESFYDPKTGFDIDGAWIDMNEPASFCTDPCDDPFAQAAAQNLPPQRTSPPPNQNAAIFYQKTHAKHNLYGTMMSVATHDAMLARRPGQRTLVITRSTFVGKWLGDNLSSWDHYRTSIAGMLGMASLFQVPMVGSDICGFGDNTTETLCARWATLGAFYPFMRNEFYRWPSVTQAAKHALDIRYRLLDYFYTAFHQASVDGSPVLNPLWFKYPKDTSTYGIDLQFFFGDSILVSPVTDENATSVSIYLPKDRFYDFATLAPVDGKGEHVTLSNINFTEIPLHIRGGALRAQDFQFVVAPGRDGTAAGGLYVDDGVSIKQHKTTSAKMAYGKGKLSVSGSFDVDARVASVLFLGVEKAPKTVSGPGYSQPQFSYDAKRKVLVGRDWREAGW
ncbi:glycoside hydrolase family 31 protein [Lactarius indigo]|nr:glycoside hydrolase family 31 protein [Lactarius indigo]